MQSLVIAAHLLLPFCIFSLCSLLGFCVLLAVVISDFHELNTNSANGGGCVSRGPVQPGGGGEWGVTELIEEDGEGMEGEPEGLSGC